MSSHIYGGSFINIFIVCPNLEMFLYCDQFICIPPIWVSWIVVAQQQSLIVVIVTHGTWYSDPTLHCTVYCASLCLYCPYIMIAYLRCNLWLKCPIHISNSNNTSGKHLTIMHKGCNHINTHTDYYLDTNIPDHMQLNKWLNGQLYLSPFMGAMNEYCDCFHVNYN